MVAYFFSRLAHIADQDMVEDVFPDEHLFLASAKKQWFSGMKKYLATTNFPQHFSNQE